jgi:hypothetical protein
VKKIQSYWDVVEKKCKDCPTNMFASSSLSYLNNKYYPYRCYALSYRYCCWGNKLYGEQDFFSAKYLCQNMYRGASLMRIENSDEYQLAKNFASQSYVTNIWVFGFIFFY